MLIIRRKRQGRVRLRHPDGTVVWLTLTAAAGGEAAIGIEAPPGVEVTREELLPREELHKDKKG